MKRSEPTEHVASEIALLAGRRGSKSCAAEDLSARILGAVKLETPPGTTSGRAARATPEANEIEPIMSKQKRAEVIALETCAIKQTRIARKMHDDLLQNFGGMMFQFQAARNLMTRHPDEALLSLNEAIKDAQTPLDESRNAIQDLSSSCEGKL